MPAELIRILGVGLVAVMALSVGLNGLVLVYVERKVAGHVQRRPGPYRGRPPRASCSPWPTPGKLVGKQLFMPDNADPILFWLAPVLSFLPVLLLCFAPALRATACSPWTSTWACCSSWPSPGWRCWLAAAGRLGAEQQVRPPRRRPRGGAVRGLRDPAAAGGAGGLLPGRQPEPVATVVKAQGAWPWQWNILTQPLAFLIYIVSALAETNRAPFDLPEAESELTAGFHTEYSGMGFGLFFLAEYANMVVVCSVATALFLGGWQGPFLAGPVWFVLKVSLLMAASGVLPLDLPARAVRPAPEHQLEVAVAPGRGQPAAHLLLREAGPVRLSAVVKEAI